MSSKYGIRAGQEIGVLFYRDQEFLGACLIRATTAEQVAIELHTYEDEDLLVLKEAALAASGAISFEMDKPRLKRMVADRIKELNEQSEGGEGSYPPTPPTTDLPF